MKTLVISFIVMVCLISCDNSYQLMQQNTSISLPDRSIDDNINFHKLSSDYFEQQIMLNPISALSVDNFLINDQFVDNLSDDYLRKQHELNTLYLGYLNSLKLEKLTEKNKLSFNILKLNLETNLQGEAFPNHYIPFTQFNSLMSKMAKLGSGQGAQPFNTVKDYDNFNTRLSSYILWFDSAILRLRQGINNKVVLPRILVKRLIDQLQLQVVESIQDSTFYSPIYALPDSFTQSEKQRITLLYSNTIKDKLIPAYQKLITFLNNEYLPSSRATDGYGSMPNGLPWYQYLANKHTTTTMNVDDIHELGLKEVKRITQEMDNVRVGLNFEGNLTEFFHYLSHSQKFYFDSKIDLINGYAQYKEQIEAVLPLYFDVKPKSSYEVKAVEKFRERNAAGASYSPGSPDGVRPGIFYVNTYNLKAQPKWGMMTLSLHEASPGHHFQISLSQELDDLPQFQKFGFPTAFIEGWALYSEYLGVEMGLFKDPYLYFGKLADEMLRAMRLVVDTGLHAKGWSREQAIAYMLKHSTLVQSDVVAEVERYMAIPGQALSYKIGQLKIMELRSLAEKELGVHFDIKEFHNQVLLDGALPLNVLEKKIILWVNTVKKTLK